MTYPVFASGDVLNASDMNAVGMWKLGTMTFSSSTGQNLDNVFSSSYRNYLVTWDLNSGSGTNSDNVALQLRKGGVTAVTDYNNTWIYTLRTSASPLTAYDGAGTFLTCGYVGQNVASGFLYISRPAITGPTGFVWQGGGNGSTQGIIASGQGSHTTSDTYDGFRIGCQASTGVVNVYGLRD